jgi:hypothetical protein
VFTSTDKTELLVFTSDGDIQAQSWRVLVSLRKAAIVDILPQPRQLIILAMKLQIPFISSDSYTVGFFCELFFIVKNVPSGLIPSMISS